MCVREFVYAFHKAEHACVYCMREVSETTKEERGRFSRCAELEKALTRPQLCQICPNQTRGAEKTQATLRGLLVQRNRQRKRKGRHPSVHYYSPHLVSGQGQDHEFQGIKKNMTISRKIIRF